MEDIIDIHQLTVNYEKTSALWDINVSIPKGSLVGIIGPNGAGKSTLLKALLGLVKPLSGNVHFFGKPFNKIKEKIAYVPQKGSIDWDFPITVFDVVLMGRFVKLRGLKWYTKADKQAARRMLDCLEMGDLSDRQISALSGGQQQRLFIARALLQEADILLLDEPFAAVDKATEDIIIRLLKKLREEGKTILVVHHDLNTAPHHFDQALLLNTSLVAYGNVEETLTPRNLSLAYGQRGELFDEATRLSGEQKAGFV